MPDVIALFLSDILKKDCVARLGKEYSGCRVEYFSFQDHEELLKKYEAKHSSFSAVIADTSVTGQLLKPWCRRDGLPLACFSVSLESIYRSLIVEGFINSCVDLDKTGLDFIKPEVSLRDILVSGDLQQEAERTEKVIAEWPEEDVKGLEDYVPSLYRRRLELENLEFILTRNERVMNFAAESGREAHYVYPTMSELHRALDETVTQIRLMEHKKNLPAVISFDIGLKEENSERREIEFRKVLFDFEKDASVHLPVKSSHALLEVYTDAATVQTLTCDYKGCWLSGYLKARLDFAVRIGYGVGDNISQARLHSSDALSACCAYERVRLIDERGTEFFLSPCTESDCPSVSEEEMKTALRLSSKAGLSSDVIVQFMLCIKELGRNEISSSDIMSCAGFSLRSANKYLSRLESAGLAAVCGQRSYGSKGRPTKIYRILFEED